MTKSEMAKVLAILRANYPNIRIENPEAMVKTWMLTLGGFNVEAVMKSAELHMTHSKFFPTPAELRQNITRSKIFVELPSPTVHKLEASKRQVPDGMSEEEFLESIIQSQIQLETEMYGNLLDFER